MTFDEYQSRAAETALYPNVGSNYHYPALGLGGETGEVLEAIKKLDRDDNGIITDAKQSQIQKELGDVLWYVSNLAREFGLSLDVIAYQNLQKLNSRKERGQIHGSGDDR